MSDGSPLSSPPTASSGLSSAGVRAAVARRRVLVVEDNDDARRLMQRLLQMWGYEVVAAGDGHAAVDAAVAQRPGVALIDLGLPPGMDGYEVARRLRATFGRDIRLIALTGYGEPEDRDRTADAGFELHLLKPIHPDRLAQTLEQLSDSSPSGGAAT